MAMLLLLFQNAKLREVLEAVQLALIGQLLLIRFVAINVIFPIPEMHTRSFIQAYKNFIDILSFSA